MTPDEFVAVLRTSLNEVGHGYYGKDYFSENKILDAVILDGKKCSALKDHLKRFGERVFCYELYHQLQCQLHQQQHDDDGPILQGELKKDNIRAIVSVMPQGIEPLDKEFIPDFLYHSPVNFDHQQVVMEVKANPKVSFDELYDDLKKLDKFTTNYNYKLGILLVVNNDIDRIKKLLVTKNDRLRVIKSSKKILLMVKCNKESPLWELALNEIKEV